MTARFDIKSNVPNERVYRARLLGVNGAAPTKEFGPGMTFTRESEGLYRATFIENPGTFIGIGGYMFGDTTPDDVKNKTIKRDTYVAATETADAYVEFHVFESGTLDDIETTEYLDISFVFSAGGI